MSLYYLDSEPKEPSNVWDEDIFAEVLASCWDVLPEFTEEQKAILERARLSESPEEKTELINSLNPDFPLILTEGIEM